MRSDPLSGTWFIVATSLPFWRHRTDPSVTYGRLPDGRVLDAVSYRRRGRPRLVLGADTRGSDGTWTWRGLTPLTRLTSSSWQVVAADDAAEDAAGRWAVTAFDKTLFTPAGVDVYCRAPRIAAAAREAAESALNRAHAAYVAKLFVPERT